MTAEAALSRVREDFRQLREGIAALAELESKRRQLPLPFTPRGVEPSAKGELTP